MASTRKIIHIDCDCFYAAVEMRDNPDLRDRPLAIGGKAEQRGVIATCNYPARAFGIHSAMSTRQALLRCPQLVLLPPDMAKYKTVSRQIISIYQNFTQLIEPLALDEAYLDVSGLPHYAGSATRMAEAIRQRIHTEIGITASAGVAPNKFLAKVASDWNKPDGLKVIRPEAAKAFIASLPIDKFPGVGPVTAKRMHQLGLCNGTDLQNRSQLELIREFGRVGQRLFQLARGEDDRLVEPERVRRSLSVEETWPADLPDLAACLAELPALIERLLQRLAQAGNPPFHGLSCKIKFADFSQTTVEQHGTSVNIQQLAHLLQDGFARGQQSVRLLGIGVRLVNLHAQETPQLPLF